MELGPFVKCPHPEMIEAIALAGFDFAVVDMEHTPLGPRDLYPLVLAAECRELELIVRVPELSEAHLKWCLDLGVLTIQVPHVITEGDVKRAGAWTRFAPSGRRGLCRFVRAAVFSALPIDAYMAISNREVRLVLQIEDREGLDNLGLILTAAPRNSVIFFGPYDISAAMGKPGAVRDPEVTRAIESGFRRCKWAGFKVGIFASDAQEVEFWTERGADMIEYGSDLAVFMDGAKLLRDTVAGMVRGARAIGTMP